MRNRQRRMNAEIRPTMTDNDYEIVINPPVTNGKDDWKSCVEQSYRSNNWRLCDDDYEIWLKIFGETNFQLYIAKEKSSGKVLGFVTFGVFEAMDDSPRLAQLGCFWVSPEVRGMGIGGKLFSQAIEKEKRIGTNIYINAALHMSPKYAQTYGFDKVAGHQLFCWHLKMVNIEIDLEQLKSDDGVNIIDGQKADMDAVIEFDRQIAGNQKRRNHLWHHFRRKDVFAKVASLANENKVIGYCGIKAVVGDRLLLCPWYASNPQIAETLLISTLQSIPDVKARYHELIFYLPTCNIKAIEIVDRLCNGKKQEFYRICSQATKEILPVQLDHVYAIMAYSLTFT